MATLTVLVYAIVALVSLAFFYLRKRMSYWKEQGIPHDKPSWLNGNFQGLKMTRSIADCTRDSYERRKGSGPFCGFYYFQRPAVLVLEPTLVKNILIKDFSNFTDRGLFNNKEDDPLTGHLFMLDGHTWKNLRHKLSPTFTSGKMKFMYPTIINVAEKFVGVLQETIQKSEVIEIKELLVRFTTDIIGCCAFGINCNKLKDPNAEFIQMGRRALTDRRHGKLLSIFLQGNPKWAKALHMKIMPDDITTFFLRIVRETVEYRQQNNIKTNDFLSILMDLKSGDGNKTNISISLEEMAAQVFVFFVGGFETSSSTMGFALYELALNQDIQQKMRDEINEIFDENNQAKYEDIHGLDYMGQVISETLRKYPILPHLNRQALDDYIVPGHPKYVIKKGMPILIPAYAMHYDPSLYPNPEEFDPERFNADAIKQRDPIEWLAFGDGPRNCIGMRFGWMQTRVGLAYLLRYFRISTCDKTEIPLEYSKTSFVLSTKNGIFLKVERVLSI